MRVSAQQRVRVHVTELADDQLVVGADPPHTTAARTAWDCGAWLSPEKAVAIADAMLHGELVTGEDLDHQIQARAGRRGSRRACTALVMADGGTKDPLESALRVRLLRNDVPRPVLNHPVVFGSGFSLQTDMAWPEYKVCLEYKTQRLALLTAAGWIAVHAPRARIRRDLPAVLREVRSAIIRRNPRMARRWARPYPGGPTLRLVVT